MNDSVCTMTNPHQTHTQSFNPEADVMIGAYFITHLRDVCENCYTRNTYVFLLLPDPPVT